VKTEVVYWYKHVALHSPASTNVDSHAIRSARVNCIGINKDNLKFDTLSILVCSRMCFSALSCNNVIGQHAVHNCDRGELCFYGREKMFWRMAK